MKKSKPTYYRILELLEKSDKLISAKEIAEKLDKTPRRIGDYLTEFKNLGIVKEEIISGRKSGYILVKKSLEKESTVTTVRMIEDALSKDETLEPKLFRPGGPCWIDFKKNNIPERKEVENIISEFDYGKKDIIFLKGSLASGKSVVLRNVGYLLAGRDKRVACIIELKKERPDIKDILKLKDSKAYLLIDDAHLDVSYVDELIEKLSGVKILVATRDIENHFGLISPYKLSEHFKEAWEIKSYDVVEAIINNFLRINGRQIKEKFGIEKPVNEVIKKLNKDNLWILAWQLEAFLEYGKVDMPYVYRRVKDYMRINLKDLEVTKAEDVFLPLSVFYQYEISVEKIFLIRDLGVDEKDIDTLVRLNEIIEKDDLLAMHHSSLAEMYLDTIRFKFNGRDFLGKGIKDKLGDNWFFELFHLYIQRYPSNSNGVIRSLYIGRGYLEGGVLIENLFERKETRSAILEGMKHESNTYNFNICLQYFLEKVKLTKKEESKLLGATTRIFKKTGDLCVLCDFSDIFCEINSKFSEKFIDSLNKEDLFEKVRSGNITEISLLLCIVLRMRKDIRDELVEEICAPEVFEQSILKEANEDQWLDLASNLFLLRIIDKKKADELVLSLSEDVQAEILDKLDEYDLMIELIFPSSKLGEIMVSCIYPTLYYDTKLKFEELVRRVFDTPLR